MSTDHLSASQRRIVILEQQVQQLLLAQNEFNIMLNYLIVKHGEAGIYRIARSDIEGLKQWIIRTEFDPNTKSLVFTRIPPPPNGAQPPEEDILPLFIP